MIETKYDLVNFEDNIIKIGTKKEARKLKLFTRSVHILLIAKNGKVMICRRSAIKKTYPNQITSSAGGHVDQGENYKTAAIRELQEELGIITPLLDAGRFNVITKLERTIHHLFIGKIDKKVLADPNEISSFCFLNKKNIKNDLFLHPRKYCKPFHEAFTLYLKYIN